MYTGEAYTFDSIRRRVLMEFIERELNTPLESHDPLRLRALYRVMSDEMEGQFSGKETRRPPLDIGSNAYESIWQEIETEAARRKTSS
jgi:hypothetical protein